MVKIVINKMEINHHTSNLGIETKSFINNNKYEYFFGKQSSLNDKNAKIENIKDIINECNSSSNSTNYNNSNKLQFKKPIKIINYQKYQSLFGRDDEDDMPACGYRMISKVDNPDI